MDGHGAGVRGYMGIPSGPTKPPSQVAEPCFGVSGSGAFELGVWGFSSLHSWDSCKETY